MSSKKINVETFLADVSKHSLAVVRDDGVYRHLRFSQPENSWNMWFEIVTWPQNLTVHGDMGTWSFSRIEDMFRFFRSSKDLKINAEFWAEKITSESRYGGPSEKFDSDTFKENVLSHLEGYDLTDRQKNDVTEALEESVFCEEEESAARRWLGDFKHGDFSFTDTWEIVGKAYTYHYLWCLYAIVWGIQQYDQRAAGAGNAVCCEDCPPVNYPTDKTRCRECPLLRLQPAGTSGQQKTTETTAQHETEKVP